MPFYWRAVCGLTFVRQRGESSLSVFHLVLSRSNASSEALPSPALGSGHSFLMIKDNLDEQHRMTDALMAADVEVDHVTTGDQAVAHARNHPYDAITLDLILSAIRSKGPSRESPVVAVTIRTSSSSAANFLVAFTAYAMKGDEGKMRAAGCDGYISKPISVSTFISQGEACLPRQGV